jgi:hypothetical protein
MLPQLLRIMEAVTPEPHWAVQSGLRNRGRYLQVCTFSRYTATHVASLCAILMQQLRHRERGTPRALTPRHEPKQAEGGTAPHIPDLCCTQLLEPSRGARLVPAADRNQIPILWSEH